MSVVNATDIVVRLGHVRVGRPAMYLKTKWEEEDLGEEDLGIRNYRLNNCHGV